MKWAWALTVVLGIFFFAAALVALGLFLAG
jgi:hypothetical protein